MASIAKETLGVLKGMKNISFLLKYDGAPNMSLCISDLVLV